MKIMQNKAKWSSSWQSLGPPWSSLWIWFLCYLRLTVLPFLGLLGGTLVPAAVSSCPRLARGNLFEV